MQCTPNLPIMQRAYVALTYAHWPLYFLWYDKIIMQRSLVIYHGISYMRLVFSDYTHWPIKARVCTEKIQVTRGIFHGTLP